MKIKRILTSPNLSMEQYTKRLAHYEDLYARHQHPSFLYSAGEASFYSEDYEKAIGYLKICHEKHNLLHCTPLLARAYIKQQKVDTAINLLEKTLPLVKADIYIMDKITILGTLIPALVSQDKFEEAVKRIDETLILIEDEEYKKSLLEMKEIYLEKMTATTE